MKTKFFTGLTLAHLVFVFDYGYAVKINTVNNNFSAHELAQTQVLSEQDIPSVKEKPKPLEMPTAAIKDLVQWRAQMAVDSKREQDELDEMNKRFDKNSQSILEQVEGAESAANKEHCGRQAYDQMVSATKGEMISDAEASKQCATKCKPCMDSVPNCRYLSQPQKEEQKEQGEPMAATQTGSVVAIGGGRPVYNNPLQEGGSGLV